MRHSSLAARVTGMVHSAFPSGPPAGVQLAAGQLDLKESTKPLNLVVFADTDMLSDYLWVHQTSFFGQRMTQALDMELVQAGGVKDLRKTIASTSALAAQMQAIAAEQNRNLTSTLAAYRRAATAIDSARIDSTLRSFSSTSQNFAKLATSLDSASRQLNNALAKLNTGEGSAGRLLTDDSLYRDIRHVVGSVDSLMNDFKKNPRKYINLRIF